jgi:hypothetical protein
VGRRNGTCLVYQTHLPPAPGRQLSGCQASAVDGVHNREVADINCRHSPPVNSKPNALSRLSGHGRSGLFHTQKSDSRMLFPCFASPLCRPLAISCSTAYWLVCTEHPVAILVSCPAPLLPFTLPCSSAIPPDVSRAGTRVCCSHPILGPGQVARLASFAVRLRPPQSDSGARAGDHESACEIGSISNQDDIFPHSAPMIEPRRHAAPALLCC